MSFVTFENTKKTTLNDQVDTGFQRICFLAWIPSLVAVTNMEATEPMVPSSKVEMVTECLHWDDHG
jgi:hypothetical protein